MDAGSDLDRALGLFSVLREDGGTDPVADPMLSDERLFELYRHMRRLRLLDEQMIALQRQGRVGFYGPSLGQEAAPVAVAMATRFEDWIFPALRESSTMLVRGFPLSRYLAQIFGSADDVLKGRQMPSHMSSRQVNVVSWSSCIATQLPHAVGVAYGLKRARQPRITVGFVGDGGTSQGDFHAALNFAGVLRVPCVFVCQNNQWAISTPAGRQTASRTIALKAHAYGMPGIRVDGNDALAVYRVVDEARRRAIAGAGPTFVECVTYRMGAHSTSDDPTRYQPAEELERWRKRDPVARLRKRLEALELIDAERERVLEQQIRAEIHAAVEEAESKPKPATSTLFDDVYASPTWNLEEQAAELRRALD